MRLLALCTLLIIAVVAATQLHADAYVPLFMWSGRPYFNAHSTAADPVSRTEFRQMFSHIVSPKQETAVDLKYLNTPVYYAKQHHEPEVIVAFVFNELNSAMASREAGAYESHTAAVPKNAQFAYLKSAVTSAASSLAAPFYVAPASAVSNSEAISHDIINLHKALAPRAQIFATEIDGSENGAAGQVSLSGCDTLLSHLAEHSHIFHNTRPDLVLVKYAVLDRNDKCMQRVDEYVTRMTSGNYLALLSADQPFALPLQTSFAETDAHVFTGNSLNNAGKFKTQANVATPIVYPGVTVITSDVFWALILALIIIIAVSCGVCWVQSIETPARFTTTTLQLAKEY